mmetsp:Transcript_56764/g.99245  ORF Transcript_56764/g.99245 Transcript_56764/m.99245 type:complete len:203 (-) Transcript_56764:98-706(-)
MGANMARPEDRTSLVKGLAATIYESTRPADATIDAIWNQYDVAMTGSLPPDQVKQVLKQLLDFQVKEASTQASKTKLDMAKQQAELEKAARLSRNSIVSNPGSSKDDVNRAMALHMGSVAGPTMAGMMSGYVDIPVACLNAVQEREGEELMDLWVQRQARNGRVPKEVFVTEYRDFYTSAPRVLGAGTSENGAGADYECAVQ